MFICSSSLFHISLGKDVPGLNFMVVTLQVESGIFIDRTISNRIWNLYLLPSPLSIRMLLEIGQRCSSKKITSFWRVSKDYDKLSLGDENGFLCEMVGQGSAQVLGENGLPKWSRIGSLVRWLCFWHIGRFQRLLKLQSIMHLQIVEFYGKIIRCASSSSFRSTTRCRSQATCPNSLFNRHKLYFLAFGFCVLCGTTLHPSGAMLVCTTSIF